MGKGLFDPKKIVVMYIKELVKAGIHPEEILLFGSYASGTTDAWSDIDLVVISRDFEKIPPLKRLEMLSLATFNLHAPIEALGYTPGEIERNGNDSIMWESIQKNHKRLYKCHHAKI